MDTILPPEHLRTIYDQSIRLVTKQTAGILLNQEEIILHDDVCTVYTLFDKNVHSSLAMCADLGLFTRLTQRMMQSEKVSAQDIEDFTKEYFNILCGHIAVALFRDTKAAARFQIPEFHSGRYQPDNRRVCLELAFRSDQNEGARLIHYAAVS